MEAPVSQPKLLPSARALLREAWAIYKRNIRKFIYLMMIPFVFLVPSVLLSRYFQGSGQIAIAGQPKYTAIIVFGWILLAILGIFGQLLFVVCSIFIIKERQANVGAKEALKYGWSKLASYFWVWLLATIFIGIGLFVLVVPGIILSVWYCLVSYVFVAEEKKGLAALARSKELVRGSWWNVLWRLIVIGIAVAIPSLPFSFLADYGQKINLVSLGFLSGIAALFISLLLQGFSVSYGFLLYEKLREIKGSSE